MPFLLIAGTYFHEYVLVWDSASAKRLLQNPILSLVLGSTDPDVDKVVEEIEKTVQDFLQSDEALKSIQNEKYQVVISSIDKKKMKVISN